MPFLEFFFNSIFESGVYLDTRVSGLITPIHKKGDKLNPENYRKVTVLPALGKLFEIVLENRLTYKNEVCCDNDQFQAGFKANCRTSDNIFILYSLVEHSKKYKKPLYVCYIDLTKAFDYIDRSALFHKLAKRNINGKFLNIIKNMYSKSKMRIARIKKITLPF